MESIIKDISIADFQASPDLEAVFVLWTNAFEALSAENRDLKLHIEELRAEVARLTKGNEKPKFGKVKPTLGRSKDWSSKEAIEAKSSVIKGPKVSDLKITRIAIYDDLPKDLPIDSYRLSDLERVQQEIQIVAEVVLYKVARWYSPSEGKTYSSATEGVISGGYGTNLQTFIQFLHHFGDMTQSKVKELLNQYQIKISSGSVSEILNSQLDWVVKERLEILKAGIAHSPYLQSDSTQCKESGKSQKTHIFGSDSFSVFYSTPGKSRLDLLAALQDLPQGGIELSYTKESQELLQQSAVSDKHLPTIAAVFENCNPIKLQDFQAIMSKESLQLANKPTVMKTIAESLALGHYRQQSHTPTFDCLLTDNAPEYKHLAKQSHGLCWIHDARNYQKLMPQTLYFQEVKASFMSKYWIFYRKLLAFKKDPLVALKISIQTDFEELFATITPYDALNDWIKHTLKYQKQLLAVLDNPALPLHNNAAELAARRVVRKRDISLHTMSSVGTTVRDGFLSIIQTAQKLGINALQYIANANKGTQISLAESIRLAYAK